MEEYNETIDELKLTKITTIAENNYKCNSRTVYIVLFPILVIINVGIDAYFVYCNYVNPNKENVSKYYDYVYHP